MDSETEIICSENILTDRISQPADYVLESDFAPNGDQPMAIEELMEGVTAGERDQVLLACDPTSQAAGPDSGAK